MASPYVNANWISYPHGCVTNDHANHSCSYPNHEEVYYKVTFNLPALSCGQSISTPSAYCLSFDFFADNCVSAVFVNGVLSYSTSVALTGTPNQWYYLGYNNTGKVTVTLCDNWQSGSNSIIVLVRSGPGSSSTWPTWEGLLAQANHTVNTSVGIPLSANISASNAPCFGQTGSATVNATGGVGAYSYSWIPSGGTGSVATSLAAGLYSCIVTSGTACSTTNTVLITQPPALSLTVTKNDPQCANGVGTATAFAAGAHGSYSYSWMPGGGTNSLTSSLPPGNYNVVVTSSGCTQSASFSINPSSPTISVQNSTIACFGGSSSASATVSGGGGGAYSYQWLPSAATGSIVSGLPAGSYTNITTGSCGSYTTVFAITQPPALSLSIISPTNPVCSGKNVTIFAQSTGGTGAHQYTWTNGPATSQYNIGPLSAGNYSFMASVTDVAGCSSSATANINVYNELFLSAFNATFCEGSSGTLTATGGQTYTWHPGPGFGSNYVVNPVVHSTYTVNSTAASGCTAVATASVHVKPAPLLSYQTQSINCAHLGSATVSASGGIGPFSFSWQPTGQTSSQVSGLYPGTYTISVEDAGSDCIYELSTTFYPLVPLTGTVSTNGTVSCFGDTTAHASIVLSGGSGAQTYTWVSPTAKQQNVISPTNLGAGIHTITVSDALTFCTLSHTFQVIQPPQPTLSIAGTANSVCIGSAIQLTATMAGGTPAYTYTWNNSATAQTIQVQENNPGNYLQHIAVSDAHNCNTIDSVLLKFVENPTVTATSVSICPKASGMLFATGANTYSWNNGQTGQTITVSPSVSTNYTVIGSAKGCVASATAVVFLKNEPAPVLLHNGPLCSGDTLQLNSATFDSYSWEGPGSFSSALQSPVIPNALPLQSGIYTLAVTAANACTAATTASISINPLPSVIAAASTVCAGQGLNIWAGYINGATYSWMGPSGFTGIQQNFTRPNADTSMSGIYSVTITSTAGCKSSGSVQAQVIIAPTPVISGSTSACTGDTIKLLASGANSFQWSGPANFYFSGANVFVLHQGTYSLQAGYGPCISSTQISLSFLPSPSPAIVITPTTLCENAPIQFSTSENFMSYQWSGPDLQTNLSSPVITGTIRQHNNIYTLTVTDQFGCKGKDTIILAVNPSPTLSVSGATVCAGGTATLAAAGADTYSWAGPGNFFATGTHVIINPVNNTSAGNYLVTGTALNGCSSTHTAQVQLNGFNVPIPYASIQPSVICINTQVQLLADGGDGYLWSGPAGFRSAEKKPMLVINTIDQAGIYTLTAHGGGGCASSATTEVQLFPIPELTLSLNRNYECAPFCSGLNIRVGENSPMINSGELTLNDNIITNYSNFCVTQAGEHPLYFFYTDSNSCRHTEKLSLIAYEKPEADFTYYPLNPQAGLDAVTFYGKMRSGLNHYWFIADDENDTVTAENFTRLFQKSGKYAVALVVQNSHGCIDTVTRIITVTDEFTFYVPDAFSPNNDGVNDVFMAKGEGIEHLEMQVFNRWGELIFFTAYSGEGWDGRHEGKPCKPDYYTWKISVKSSAQKQHNYIGKVLLLK